MQRIEKHGDEHILGHTDWAQVPPKRIKIDDKYELLKELMRAQINLHKKRRALTRKSDNEIIRYFCGSHSGLLLGRILYLAHLENRLLTMSNLTNESGFSRQHMHNVISECIDMGVIRFINKNSRKYYFCSKDFLAICEQAARVNLEIYSNVFRESSLHKWE